VDEEKRWFTATAYQAYTRARLRFLELSLGASRSQLDEVIKLTESAAAGATTPSGLSAAHFLLGRAYRARYDAYNSLDDLTWSLRSMRQAVEEDPRQDRGRRLYVLANSLLDVVEMLKPGEQPAAEHLKLIEQWLREARPLLDAKDAAMCQGSLGLAYLQRFRHFGSRNDWSTALENLEAARDAATNDADRAACWGNIGQALMIRLKAERNPETEIAVMAIGAFDKAAQISPADDPNHSAHVRFQRISRESLGLPPEAPSPWVTMDNGVRINIETGEIRPPS
jgi:tetratricopeptide (TPR) repeat protein